MAEVALRPIEDSDLDALLDQMRDPESVRMAAFTAENPDDRTASPRGPRHPMHRAGTGRFTDPGHAGRRACRCP